MISFFSLFTILIIIVINIYKRQKTIHQHTCLKKGKVCIRAKWPIRPELIPVSVAWSDWEYFYSPLDGMLVHRKVIPSIKFAGTHLYTWVERGTVRVKCLAQEHNTMSPARSRTRTAHSRVECTNHEATEPPTILVFCKNDICLLQVGQAARYFALQREMKHIKHRTIVTHWNIFECLEVT